MYKSPRVILNEFIKAFSQEKHKMLIFDNWKWMFGVFFSKTGSVNSATEKGGGGQQCTNVTLPRKKTQNIRF